MRLNFDPNILQLTEASLPSKQKRPAKILSGSKTSAYGDICDSILIWKAQ